MFTTRVSEDLAINLPMSLTMPGGLNPFGCKQFTLAAVEDAPPFLRLEAEDRDLVFHLLDPFLVLAEYEPEISDEDENELDLLRGEETLILAIVNLNGSGAPTVNLSAPLVINLRTGLGKQAILANAAKYAVRHSIVAP